MSPYKSIIGDDFGGWKQHEKSPLSLFMDSGLMNIIMISIRANFSIPEEVSLFLQQVSWLMAHILSPSHLYDRQWHLKKA